MTVEIGFSNDVTNADEKMRGSDGRANVSSRSDTRAYYNSRDLQEAYSLVWDDASTGTGDYVLYWQNTDTTGKHLVITDVIISSQYGSDWQLQIVTGTAGGGSSATPSCLNRAAPRVAAATARTAVSSTVTIGAIDVIIEHVAMGAREHAEMHMKDLLRLGQDGAIAIQCILHDTTPGTTEGTVYGYYE